MYSKAQREYTLNLYHQCGSVTKTVCILRYPRNPSANVKSDAVHRCFELGESVKLVSEKIGYTRASIYAWRKTYLQGALYRWLINGYRRIHQCLAKEGIKVSEKVVRRIMKNDSLKIKIKKTRNYNSYKG